jgi:hypothetical protein
VEQSSTAVITPERLVGIACLPIVFVVSDSRVHRARKLFQTTAMTRQGTRDPQKLSKNYQR